MHKDTVLVLGDIHGRWYHIKEIFADNTVLNAAIFQIGDFGLGFRPMAEELAYLAGVNEELAHRNIHLFIMRGNHDNPAYFRGDVLRLSHIRLLADYAVVEINRKRILCVGGAISVDRLVRQQNNNFYWPDEEFYFCKETTAALKDIDIVLTHSAPEFAYPVGYGPRVEPFLVQDKSLANDLLNERIEVSKLYNQLKANHNKITHWYYGHFHQHYEAVYENIQFILLNIAQLYSMKGI